MAGTKIVTFDARDFMHIVTHYSDGLLPLDFELKHVAIDTILKRQIAFIGNSKQWEDTPIPGTDDKYNPLQIRYERKRIMSYGKKGTEPFWQDSNDTPDYRRHN